MKLAAAAMGVLTLLAAQHRALPVKTAFQTTGITPSQGPIAGGTVVTISGTSLANSTVFVDGQLFPQDTQSDFAITLTMAPHDNGYVAIAVKSVDGAVAYHRYLYLSPRLEDLPAGYITTLAGVGMFKGDFGPAAAATVGPNNLVYDAQGNLYVAEPGFNQVSRITPDGVIERIAGSGVTPTGDRPCCGDGGPALQALIGFPRGVALDADGNVLIGGDDSRIRRVDRRTGIITTVAGDGVRGFTGDGGPAARARLSIAPRLAVVGGDLFFLDFDNARVRRIGVDGRISTVAGNGTRGFSGDGGPATAASFDFNADSDGTAMAADRSGNLFVLEAPGQRVRRIDGQSGVISTFYRYQSNGTPQAMVADPDGNLYVSIANAIVKLTSSGTLLRSWGSSPNDVSPDGTLLDQLHFGIVTGMALDGAGNLVISDQTAGRVRRMNFATNRIETIAGNAPNTIGEEGPAAGAALDIGSGDIALTRSGDLLIADTRIRRVDAAGTITTIAGHAFATQANRDNVPALNVWNGAYAIFVGPGDEIDTATFGSAFLYHIDRAGIQHAVIRQSRSCDGNFGDGGLATSGGLCEPWDVTRDRDGNLYYAGTNNNRVRRVDARSGIITTFAGSGPVNGFENYYPGRGRLCGDSGPATSACLATPASITFDADGNLFIADTMNYRIRRVDRISGVITTFVTMPIAPFTIRFGPDGNLYTTLGDRIVRFDRTGTMQTIAGREGQRGFTGDGGPAWQARVDRGYAQSAGVAVNSAGDVFFVDAGNRRVRVVKAGAQTAR